MSFYRRPLIRREEDGSGAGRLRLASRLVTSPLCPTVSVSVEMRMVVMALTSEGVYLGGMSSRRKRA